MELLGAPFRRGLQRDPLGMLAVRRDSGKGRRQRHCAHTPRKFAFVVLRRSVQVWYGRLVQTLQPHFLEFLPPGRAVRCVQIRAWRRISLCLIQHFWLHIKRG